MTIQKRDAIQVLGIHVKTSNKDGQAMRDIPALWQKFTEEAVADKVSEKLSDEIFAVYCEYESDHDAPYTCLLGYQVPANTSIPAGLKLVEIPQGKYAEFEAKGDLTKMAVANAWYDIWKQPLSRTYQADYEVYGAKAVDPTNGAVDIYVGLKN